MTCSKSYSIFHILHVLSLDPVAKYLPLSEKETVLIEDVWLEIFLTIPNPYSAFQILQVLSLEPVAKYLQLSEKATE